MSAPPADIAQVVADVAGSHGDVRPQSLEAKGALNAPLAVQVAAPVEVEDGGGHVLVADRAMT